jgi:carnosine N-methyltransferase
MLAAPPINYLDTLNAVDSAIDANADIADAILDSGLASLGLTATDGDEHAGGDWQGTATKTDVDKARSTLHQLYRDWSSEGSVERSACFTPVLRDLARRLSPSSSQEIDPPRVLVPGAGLGRLVLDLACAGYNAEGNELSYHQLLASSFVLNHTTKANQFPLYPFASSFSNHLRREDQLQKVMIPDVHPASVLNDATVAGKQGSMSMTTGDFNEVYSTPEYGATFDAVTTVFFIDTAPNVLTYIETIKHCLKPGGLWINLGPLLYHFESNKNDDDATTAEDDDNGGDQGRAKQKDRIGTKDGSLQLTHEELLKVVEMTGFVVEEVHEAEVEATTGYVQNPRSMLQNVYKPVRWIAVKV